MFDFIRFCSAHGIRHIEGGHHHAHQGWSQIHCPYCKKKNWTLGFNLSSGALNCWKCGTLKLRDVIRLLIGTQDPQKIAEIFRTFQREGSTAARQPVVRKRLIVPPPGTAAMGDQHKRYLAERAFDPERLADLWDLQGTFHLSGKWSWRVIIPIADADGRVVAFQGRAIGKDTKPKYKMTDDKDCLEDPDTILYGLDKVPGDTVLVVEGATGVWRLGPGTVGTLGIDWKIAQLNKLRRYKRRFVLFDPGEDAQRRALELAENMALFPGTTEIVSGFETDPGDFTQDFADGIARELRLR